MWAMRLGTGCAAPVGRVNEPVQQHAAEGPLVDEAQLGRRRRSRSARAGAARRGHPPVHEQLPAHPEVGHARTRRGGRAAARGTSRGVAPRPRGAPTRRAARSAAPPRWRRTARGCRTLDRGDRAAGHPALQPDADGLDLGQLGHRRCLAARPSGGHGSAPASARQAVSAAACSASFLLRPVHGGEDLAGDAAPAR